MTDLRAMVKPCPRCGGQPAVDRGPSDVPYPKGLEYYNCQTVFLSVGGDDISCGMSAQGLTAWNHQPEADRLRAALDHAVAEAVERERERCAGIADKHQQALADLEKMAAEIFVNGDVAVIRSARQQAELIAAAIRKGDTP